MADAGGDAAAYTDGVRLTVDHLGPLGHVDLEPGDLTVVVGPQASGKSILLQTFKAIVDLDAVVDEFKRHGYHWTEQPSAFVELLYGEGMGDLVRDETRICVNGEPFDLVRSAIDRWSKKSRLAPRLFYVPAQRVLTLQEGWPRPFTSFDVETPFVVKQFSEDLRRLLEEGLDDSRRLFPTEGRWKREVRELVAEAVFHGSSVLVDSKRLRKRIVLEVPSGGELPFLSWSAGQREFIPLMLGLYWLTPSQARARRGQYEWAVVEEPEMGLHPAAISALAVVMLDLLKRGYKVLVTTHSPHLLELVWAIRRLQPALTERPDLLARLFAMKPTDGVRELAQAAARKQFRVLYLRHTENRVISKDISSLDPDSDDPDVAGWGGLTDFAERAHELVGEAALFPSRFVAR